MKNISNREIFNKCTQCSNCGERSWYIMECDCGNIFCMHCSKTEVDEEMESMLLTCPKCNKSILYV